MEELKEGYIFDYISGIQVKETPEEIEAVQPFSKILVDDYGYPKENIHTETAVSSESKTVRCKKRISCRYSCI